MNRDSFRSEKFFIRGSHKIGQLVRSLLRPTIARQFALAYHDKPEKTWLNTYWMGHRIWKLPADMWIYQELIFEIRPDLIIETGTAEGGSALYMAHLLDMVGHGRIVTIDVEDFAGRPKHERISYLRASSSDVAALEQVLADAAGENTVMVILDSDHSQRHVLDELNLLAGLVSLGSYLIVEDSNVNGHPVLPQYGPGPMEALGEWLPNHPEFRVDQSREKFIHTFNPGGYLRRIS